MRTRLLIILKKEIAAVALALAFVLSVVAPQPSLAGALSNCEAAPTLRRNLESLLEINSDQAAARARVRTYRARLAPLEDACRQGQIPLCRDPRLSAQERNRLLKALAQVDNERTRTAFLEVPPDSAPEAFARLSRYIEKRLTHCEPPMSPSCSSERWEMAIEDFLSKSNRFPAGAFRHFRRWDDDEIEARIPGLAAFIKKYKSASHSFENNSAYADEISDGSIGPGAICVVSEQACKKTLNDVNKGLSDAVGNYRRELFYRKLAQVLSEKGLNAPETAYMDFKTDRFLAQIGQLQGHDPRQYQELVEKAARLANVEFASDIERVFPEIAYLSGQMHPEDWVKTASFHRPGFAPQLNETLASFKTRMMRSGARFTDDEALDLFNSAAIQFNRIADELQARAPLVRRGVIEPNGNVSYPTAVHIRTQVTGSTDSERAHSLLSGLKRLYDADKEITLADAKRILDLWKAQDMLSIPLSSGDKMESVEKGVAVLGGDGIGGGAYDAWAKGNGLRDQAGKISAAWGQREETARRVFTALKEGDGNATQIIRAAPGIARKAVEELSPELKRAMGIDRILTSADDTVIPADGLALLSPHEREQALGTLAYSISRQSQDLTLSRAGRPESFQAGPGILRFFGGVDKSAAESAEKFLKPIEQRLSRQDILGPTWRKQYPKLGIISWKNQDGSISLHVAGPSVNEQFKSKFIQAMTEAIRGTQERVQVHFVTHAPQ